MCCVRLLFRPRLQRRTPALSFRDEVICTSPSSVVASIISLRRLLWTSDTPACSWQECRPRNRTAMHLSLTLTRPIPRYRRDRGRSHIGEWYRTPRHDAQELSQVPQSRIVVPDITPHSPASDQAIHPSIPSLVLSILRSIAAVVNGRIAGSRVHPTQLRRPCFPVHQRTRSLLRIGASRPLEMSPLPIRPKKPSHGRPQAAHRHSHDPTRPRERALGVLRGAPLGRARGNLRPEAAKCAMNEEPFDFHGHSMVGGCRKAFCREDALRRHLRKQTGEGRCLGDEKGVWQPGNKPARGQQP
ncbi:hypothetical protein C8T65DRAFT_253595 [Cerioporus squamosus]|nr:hypothetical protein C8T65DRAFT_253595 [Cerioporus squamosus]